MNGTGERGSVEVVEPAEAGALSRRRCNGEMGFDGRDGRSEVGSCSEEEQDVLEVLEGVKEVEAVGSPLGLNICGE